MSLFSFPTGRERPVYAQLSGTSATILYTAGQSGATVLSLSVNEIAGSTPTITIDVHDGTNVVVRRCVTKALTARQQLGVVTIDGNPLVLLPNHSLRATASAGNQIDIDAVVIEPFDRS